MSEMNREDERVEQWLTRGQPRAIRTRGSVRTRGGAALASGVTIHRIEGVDELLEQMKLDVPEIPWIIVVDGYLDSFAVDVCTEAQRVRERSRFWVVDSGKEVAEQRALTALASLRLDPQDADDLRFLENLVADLVIVSTEPVVTQGERVQRWLPRARYMLTSKLEESVKEALQRAEVVGASGAEIYLLK